MINLSEDKQPLVLGSKLFLVTYIFAYYKAPEYFEFLCSRLPVDMRDHAKLKEPKPACILQEMIKITI